MNLMNHALNINMGRILIASCNQFFEQIRWLSLSNCKTKKLF